MKIAILPIFGVKISNNWKIPIQIQFVSKNILVLFRDFFFCQNERCLLLYVYCKQSLTIFFQKFFYLFFIAENFKKRDFFGCFSATMHLRQLDETNLMQTFTFFSHTQKKPPKQPFNVNEKKISLTFLMMSYGSVQRIRIGTWDLGHLMRWNVWSLRQNPCCPS